MANTAAPTGFRAVGQQDGASPTAGFDTMYILSSDTNSYFTGDPVILSTAAPGYITLPASGTTTGQAIAGIFVGCEYYSAATQKVQWAATFPGNVGAGSIVTANVITNPQQLWRVQGSTNAVLGTSVIGWNIGFASTSQANGNTLSGQSAVILASSTVTAISSAPFRIVATSTTYDPPGVNGTSTGSEGMQIMIVRGANWIRTGGALTAVST